LHTAKENKIPEADPEKGMHTDHNEHDPGKEIVISTVVDIGSDANIIDDKANEKVDDCKDRIKMFCQRLNECNNQGNQQEGSDQSEFQKIFLLRRFPE
jgi:hypothetical protein